MRKTKIQQTIEDKILSLLTGITKEVASYMFEHKEIQILQDYTNTVSIKRMGFNDHGPVHMRKAALNAIIMFDLLQKKNIEFNLQKENLASKQESLLAVIVASLLHDIGMTTSRDNHEIIGANLAQPIIDEILKKFYPDNIKKRTILKSLILEGIIGHMGYQKINSLEAGLVLVGDGCDMEKGRARITSLLSENPRVGDIHKYSASSIQKVRIKPGEEKPIKIWVQMSQTVGFFQIEEVLYPKIASSPVQPYIELYGEVKDKKTLQYL